MGGSEWIKNDSLAEILLGGEKVYWAAAPTNRNIKNLVRNSYLAARVIAREKPTAVISTGAGVAGSRSVRPGLWSSKEPGRT